MQVGVVSTEPCRELLWYPSCCLGNVSVSVIISQNVPWILNISFIVGVVLTVLQCWWPPPHADLEGLVSQRPAKRAVPWGVGRRPHKNKASSRDWAASCTACVGRVSAVGGARSGGGGGGAGPRGVHRCGRHLSSSLEPGKAAGGTEWPSEPQRPCPH